MADKKSPQLKPYHWKKGQSGNPLGRIPSKKEREMQRRLARQLELAADAKSLLDQNAVSITGEIISIALAPAIEVKTINKKTGEERVRLVQPEGKIKCLLACLDRILPSLKVVEVERPAHRKPQEMSDAEILDTMDRMVRLAQTGGNQLKKSGDDGPDTLH